ncbi:MAG TPA: wax ester/triacylglycerol synthase family O-acyltransferase [Kofleriaceae bacterium]|nr:wax ester/triacylglycerol synthase family O-acyltransferase [Kofleriaceae bacterium]
MTGKRLSPSDAMFLYGESPETMMHVASMNPFSPPADASPDELRQLMDEVRRDPVVHSPWNLALSAPRRLRTARQRWVEVPEVDVEYHVRRTGLPAPGDERELGIVVSRLHGHAIDLGRPPWEVHLIEGLEGGRFAMYVKVHHALVDGYSAMRLLAGALSPDPGDRERPLFFSIPPPARPPRDSGPPGIHFPELLAQLRGQYGASKSVVQAVLRVVRRSRAGDRELVTPLRAPRCVLNARISRSRRFASQKLDASRMRAVAKAAGGTLNDVVLALSAASLRRYLLEQGALPSAPLVAMLPVSLRAKGDAGGGNAVAAMLASLATDLADPGERLAAIVSSTASAKQQMQGMSRAAILQYSSLLCAPAMLQMMPSVAGRVPPTFNLVISNVPGPEEPLYFRGARLEGSFPMSIPVHGQALNITCASYAGSVCFGFTGCRDTVPHLQRMAVFCGEALGELERAVS